MIKSQWLLVISCVHIGEDKCDVAAFKLALKTVLQLRARICFIGDTADCGCAFGTKHIGSVWENSLNPQEQIDEVVKLVRPYKNQTDLMLQGNHEGRICKLTGLEINKIVADILGIPCKEQVAHVGEYLGKRIFMAHGASRSDFQRVIKGHHGLDAVCLGHTHQLLHEVIAVRNDRPEHEAFRGKKTVDLIRCGTFLDEPRYARLALYEPNPIGAAWLNISKERIFCDLGVTPRL